MDGVHIHLLLNHFPVIGLLIATVLLTVGVIFSQKQLRTASLWLIVVLTLITIPVYLSGEQAEEAVEQGVSHNFIEAHEEAGEVGFYLMIGLGLVALVTLVAQRLQLGFRKGLTIITVLFAWAVFADMAYIGNLGGQIKHDEIRGDGISISPAAGEAEEGEAHED